MGVEKVLKRINAFSLYDLCGRALAQEPLNRGYKIYNFVDPEPCPGLEKKIF